MRLQAFDPLMKASRGFAFGSNKEVNEVVHMSVKEQPETFFSS
jgi:hypothetical protein